MDDYSADELEVHFEAMLRQRGRASKELAESVRIASLGDQKAWKKYTKALESIGEKLDKLNGRYRMTPEELMEKFSRIFGRQDRE